MNYRNNEDERQEEFSEIPPVEIEIHDRNAIVWLESEVCGETIDPIVKFIIQENITPALDSITIFIDSPGGDLSAAWKLIDIIQLSRIKIRTIGIGGVMSAALLILMGGHERLLSINTEVMSHQPTFNTSNFSAKLNDFDSYTQMFGKMFTKVSVYYSKHTGLKDKDLKKVLLGTSDEWLTAEEAVGYGFADGIIQDLGIGFWDLFVTPKETVESEQLLQNTED